MQDIITVTLVFQAVSELLLLQNVKKVQNGANFLKASLKIRFQTRITQVLNKNLKNQGNHNNVLYVVFL